MLNISGHRLGTAEIESALVLHPKVAESAVVGYPHELTGQGIYAYVTLMAGEAGSDELQAELVKLVRKEIGPIAKVNIIQWHRVYRRCGRVRLCGGYCGRLRRMRRMGWGILLLWLTLGLLMI